MKKILMTLVLSLGAFQSIQPSAFVNTAFQSIKSTLTVGNLLGYTVLPAVATYTAYNQANKPVADSLSNTQNQLNSLIKSISQSNQLSSTLSNQPSSTLGDQQGFLATTFSTVMEKLGPVGTGLVGLLSVYKTMQWAMHEYISFMEISGVLASMAAQDAQKQHCGDKQQIVARPDLVQVGEPNESQVPKRLVPVAQVYKAIQNQKMQNKGPRKSVSGRKGR